MNSLIGCSGFVGSTLLKQTKFEFHYSSKNIAEISGRSFDTVVCAGASAKKWLANCNPAEDKENISCLISHLKKIQCRSFILISTVDVFHQPVDVNESTHVVEQDLHPYGLHRRLLEKFVETHFENFLIVRLPGLVGPGLRKNIIFDLRNQNDICTTDSRAVFQFYPMVNLWADIQTAVEAGLELIHLTAEPISVADLVKKGFDKTFENILLPSPVKYDFQTRFAHLFNASGRYQYSARESILAIRSYVQSEPFTKKLVSETNI